LAADEYGLQGTDNQSEKLENGEREGRLLREPLHRNVAQAETV
jgi:hypothetical protein